MLMFRFLKKATGPESKSLLENEAAVLTAVSHPHLIKLHQVHRNRDQTVLEFEHVKSAQLRFPLDIQRLCRIMFQLAEVMGALHEQRIQRVPVDPFIRDFIYNKEDVAVKEEIWMPLMGDLY